MKLDEHPTVRQVRARPAAVSANSTLPLDAEWLRQQALDAGADDVGFVEIGRAALDDQRTDILRHVPYTRTLISFVVRMHREAIRAPARSVANLEFHHAGDEVNEVARRLVRLLEDQGIRAVNPAMGFPMEMDQFPGKLWVVSHKPVAEAAGLGRMGIHRSVIHPRFGSFVLLGTVLMDADVSAYSEPIDYNPCLECKLCIAACPVGALSNDGHFNFAACYTHNYREFMGGFTDWVEQVAESRSRLDYRQRVSDAESASMWQSLSFGANYKAAYCLAVCPAGEDVIGPYLADRKAHVKEYVRPLQDKVESLYVLPGSDAESHARKRFPHKRRVPVRNSLRPRTVDQFIQGLPLLFQREPAAGLDATYHFTFTGHEEQAYTVVIRDQAVSASPGHVGEAQLAVTADTGSWLGFLAGERSLPWALLRRKIRLKGSPRLLLRFGRCFPA